MYHHPVDELQRQAAQAGAVFVQGEGRAIRAQLQFAVIKVDRRHDSTVIEEGRVFGSDGDTARNDAGARIEPQQHECVFFVIQQATYLGD
jgi:hypothetical protein